MTIDFRAEVDKRKDALMEDLFGLLRINSERDDSKVDDKHPFGPGPVKALEHFLALAERDGYKTRNIDNYAGDFEFGQGDEVLGIFAHLDVVPAGSGWDTDPYEPVIKDGKLYARGSSDDKGPTMACYYALKIIKELELPVSKRVRFIVGTDEESGWGDMDYYFAHNGLKDLILVFHLMQNFQLSMVKRVILQLISILKVKMMENLVLCLLMVVCVKIWFLNLQVQISLDLSL